MARLGRIVAEMPIMSNFPATRPAKSCPNGISTYWGVTPRSAIIAWVSSIWYPVGLPFESLNWIGGKVRSTPSLAVLDESHLSSTDAPVPCAAAVVPGDDCDVSHAASANAPRPSAAEPPSLSSDLLVGRFAVPGGAS